MAAVSCDKLTTGGGAKKAKKGQQKKTPPVAEFKFKNSATGGRLDNGNTAMCRPRFHGGSG